ncbi:MAG: HNH endonuclease [Fibrella sp.]|nr:HNH endonuclease [Armatimonadota bacterium]
MRRSLRNAVQLRANDLCEYCRCPATHTTDVFEVEHIHPEARGGTDDLSNLAFSCSGCNTFKQAATVAVDPETEQEASLFHPRLQTWKDHFEWDNSRTIAVGITPTGRATVERLRINRESGVNLRRVLLGAGLHPPVEPNSQVQ